MRISIVEVKKKKNQSYSKWPDIWNTRMIVQERCQKLSGQ